MNRKVIQSYLDECGEVQIYTSDGEKFELHKHDVEMNNSHILIDKDEEKHLIDYYHVASLDVHESGRE